MIKAVQLVRVLFEHRADDTGQRHVAVSVYDPNNDRLMQVGTCNSIYVWLMENAYEWVPGSLGLWKRRGHNVRETDQRA